jgi:hypothetical protein
MAKFGGGEIQRWNSVVKAGTTGAQAPKGKQEEPLPEEFGGVFSKPCVEIYAHPDLCTEGMEHKG